MPRSIELRFIRARQIRLDAACRIACVLLVNVVAAATVLVATNRIGADRTVDELRRTAELMAHEGNAILLSAHRLAILVRASIELPPGAAPMIVERQFHEALAELTQAMPQIDQVRIHDRDGRLLATSSVFPAPEASLGSDPEFVALRDGGPEPRLGPPFAQPSYRGPLVELSVALRDPEGEFDGVVVVAAQLDEFQGSLGVEGRKRDLVAGWLRPDGWMMLRLPEVLVPARLDPAGSADLVLGRRSDAARQVLHSIFGDRAPRSIATVRLGQWPLAAVIGLSGDALDTQNAVFGLLVVVGFAAAALAAIALGPIGTLCAAARMRAPDSQPLRPSGHRAMATQARPVATRQS